MFELSALMSMPWGTILFVTFIVALIFFVSVLWAYLTGFREAEQNEKNSRNRIETVARIKGEKIGFEKGFESGKSEAREELKNQFISFLESQLEILKNPMSLEMGVSAKPQIESPKEKEEVFYIDE